MVTYLVKLAMVVLSNDGDGFCSSRGKSGLRLEDLFLT
jgi:hypothetical protein